MNYKKKLLGTVRKWEVVGELFDELGIKHDGGFCDSDANIIFMRVRSCAVNTDEIERGLGIRPSFASVGMVGVLTDKGVFNRGGAGWIYINYSKFLEVV